MNRTAEVTLINPPSPFLIDDRVFMPLGLLYIAAILCKQGFSVNLLDCAKDRDWLKKIDRIDSPFIGVTGTTPHFPYLKMIAEKLRGKVERLVVGGPHAQADPESLLALGFDTVVSGEAENVVAEVFSGRKGLIEAGRVVETDSLPFPARDLLDISSYRFDIGDEPALHCLLSRGCPYRCGFCCNHRQRVRYRSVENCIDEILFCRDRYDFHRFMFFDDTFSLNRNWLVDFCAAIGPLALQWRCFVRADGVDKSDLIMMKKAGCVEIGVGVESGAQKILDIIGKGTKVEDNSSCRRWCASLGITFKAFIIVGCPGEDRKTFAETRQWLLDERPDKYSVFLFTPYPGTPFMQNREKYDFQIVSPYDYGNLWWGGIIGQQISVSRTSALDELELVRLRNDLLRELKQNGLTDRNNII